MKIRQLRRKPRFVTGVRFLSWDIFTICRLHYANKRTGRPAERKDLIRLAHGMDKATPMTLAEYENRV